MASSREYLRDGLKSFGSLSLRFPRSNKKEFGPSASGPLCALGAPLCNLLLAYFLSPRAIRILGLERVVAFHPLTLCGKGCSSKDVGLQKSITRCFPGHYCHYDSNYCWNCYSLSACGVLKISWPRFLGEKRDEPP